MSGRKCRYIDRIERDFFDFFDFHFFAGAGGTDTAMLCWRGNEY